MEYKQHINLDLNSLKRDLLNDAANSKIENSTEIILNELSFRTKETLRAVYEGSPAEAKALIDSFLQENLNRIFSTIISTHCVVSPEAVEILTKEATAELSSELSRELYILSEEIDAFIANQKVLYLKNARRLLAIQVELFTLLKEAFERSCSCAQEIFKNKIMKKYFKQCDLEHSFYMDEQRLGNMGYILEKRIVEEQENDLALKEAEEKKKEFHARGNPIEMERYVLKRVFEKMRARCSSDKYRSNVYYCLKKTMENNGNIISPEETDFLRVYNPNNPKNLFSVGELAKKVKLAEEVCLSEGNELHYNAKQMEESADSLISGMHGQFKKDVWPYSVSSSAELVRTAEEMTKKMQGSEKTEMEEFVRELKRINAQLESLHSSSKGPMCAVSKKLSSGSLLEKLSAESVSAEFEGFTASLKKIQEKFPNGETKSGYKKALQDLISHTEAAREREEAIYEHSTQMMTAWNSPSSDTASLVLEVMRTLEEFPNNPVLEEKVKKMFEEILKNEPQRLLTVESIVENEYFQEELQKVFDRLDKEIVELERKALEDNENADRAEGPQYGSLLWGPCMLMVVSVVGLLFYDSGTA
ncbi:uncharacterized protein NEMAJ01_1023 [Nematocida major]|uniref:uncharacterized protein n=1 Tax=Nematocida major TaxID=1912982 RepID=UPI002007BA42|nr:uncharacterized protein NEMAJ01_1023 [Nematocida major]KAH9386127.1 hypothetical protein NEMAJ01_1023 [Nematocida major]